MVVVVVVVVEEEKTSIVQLDIISVRVCSSTTFNSFSGALSNRKNIYPYINKTFPWDLVLYAGASNNGLVEDGVEDISGDKFDCGVLKQAETSGADW